MARRLTDNEVAFILALIAGLIFIATDWTGARGIYRTFDLLNEVLGPNPPLRILMYLLVGVAALGGFAVMAGGLAILQGHLWGGRILIYLGAGGGLVTLITFGWLLYNRPGIIAVHDSFIPIALGLSLCVAAQWKAKSR